MDGGSNPSEEVNYENSENTNNMSDKGIDLTSSKDQNCQDSNSSYHMGRWTVEEHQKFLYALKQFGKDWNKVHEYIGSRTSAQTRSHA